MLRVFAAVVFASVPVVCSADASARSDGVTEDRKLTAGDAGDFDLFGASVSVSGTTAVVGAADDDHSGLSGAGSAYVFDLTTGQQVAKLTASDAGENDDFGSSVSVSGTTAVVGAGSDDHSGLIDAGSAYVFDLTTGQQAAKLTAGDAVAVDLFGASVSLSGTTAVVGAWLDDHSGVFDAGSAYVFNVTTGEQVVKLTAGDARQSDWFGPSVSVSGTTAVVGAFEDDHSGLFDAGSAYVFELDLPCSVADIAPNFGLLDLADVDAFVLAVQNQDPVADIAPNFGVIDLADIDAFITAFLAGCP